MKRHALHRLTMLAALEDRAAREALRRAAEAEHRLACEARELDALRHEAIVAEGQDAGRRMAGADAAWQVWLGMRRATVLGAQARARAELESAAETARGVFGRARATETLQANAELAARRARADLEASRLEALEIIRRSGGALRRPGGRSR